MRIVLAVEGTRGDVHPMLELGTLLAARGHEITLCAPPDFGPATQERGLRFHAVGASIRAHLEARAASFFSSSWGTFQEGRRYFESCIPAQFAALPAALEGAERVIGAGLQFAAPSLAEQRRIPYRYVAYCPVLLPSSLHPPFVVPAQRLRPFVNRALWRGVQALHERLLRPRLDAERRRLGLAPLSSAYRHLVTEHPILAADAALAPAPPDVPFRVVQVPCLHPAPTPGGGALPAKLEAFLEQGSPPVYFGFGSMTDPAPRATTDRLLAALEQLGCRGLVSAGWAGLGGGALPEGVLAIGPVDHGALFPRVAAVVHHGGAGTTTTAARAGVPQVVVPHVLDQFYWAERVRVLGLGPPPLPRRKLGSARLAEALGELLHNEVLAERAREIGARLRAAASLEPAVEALLD